MSSSEQNLYEDITDEIDDNELEDNEVEFQDDFDIKNISEDELEERYVVIADAGQKGMRADLFLAEHLKQVSRSRLQEAAKAGALRVNGSAVKSSYKVKPGDRVAVVMKRRPFTKDIIPQDIPLEIVYEDEHLMVINKPAGLVVHPGCGNYSGTLVNAIAWHMKDVPEYNPNDPSVGLVHRIDKDTSGLIVAAKTPFAKTELGKQFFNKTTRRIYNALVWGTFQEKEGTVTGNISRNPSDRMQMAVFPPESGIGKHAVTHYRIKEHMLYVSLIECKLETGRTHQIRAHMKHIGHPLFADARYGGDVPLRGIRSAAYNKFVQHCIELCPRQALHAMTLGFRHPVTNEEMDFFAPIPQDMTLLIEKWKAFAEDKSMKMNI